MSTSVGRLCFESPTSFHRPIKVPFLTLSARRGSYRRVEFSVCRKGNPATPTPECVSPPNG